VYCGLSTIVSYAQTSVSGAGTKQNPLDGKKPAATSPAAPASPIGAAKSTTQPGNDGIDSEESYTDEHTGITNCHEWVYTRGDTVISGSTARYNSKTDTLDTDDPVVMDDPKHHLTADKAHVEHAKNKPSLRLVVLTGHAVMVLKPEKPAAPAEVPPAPVQAPGSSAAGKLKVVSISSQPPDTQAQSQSKDPVQPADARNRDAQPPAADKDRENAKEQQSHGGTVTCDKIEYKTAKKFATLTGHVVFKQSFLDKDGKQVERTMTCEHAENDGTANVLHLFKPVHYESNDGQIFDSPDDVFVGTKEGEETLKMGRSHITFPSQDEDEDSNDSKSANPKGTNPKDTKDAPVKGTTRTSP
jgi:lipopolysaccharide export system protein LptA